MKNMKIFRYGLAFGLILIFSYSIAECQVDYMSHQKYWFMRTRLVEKFVKIGPGHGESLPANRYIIKSDDNNVPTSNINKRLDWDADATSGLGWYIGVLATEIKLLQDQGEDYSNTSMELWYALNAIDRLDDYAELVWEYAPSGATDANTQGTEWPTADPVMWDATSQTWLSKPGGQWNTGNSRNGFFLRFDGAPQGSDFFTYFNQYADVINAGISRPWKFSDNTADNSWDVPVNATQYRDVGYWRGNEVSQDQIFHLLMGLMLTRRFVDPSIIYNGESLVTKARDIGMRIFSHYEPGWYLKNPVWDRLVGAGEYSGAFAASLNQLYDDFDHGPVLNLWDQIYFWGFIDNPCDAIEKNYQVNRSLYSVVTAISNSTPHVDMCRYVDNRDGFDWGFYYLLRKALYPHDPDNEACNYTAFEAQIDLQICPCRGPYWDDYLWTPDGTYKTGGLFQHNNTGNPDDAAYKPAEWFMANRYLKACSNGDTRGEFAGLDYMLLFNLSKIVFHEQAVNGGYTDMRHYYFHDPILPNISYDPIGFIDMETDVVIPATAYVDAKAKEKITLLPGFNAQNGSYFHAHIKTGDWTCENGHYRVTETNPIVHANSSTISAGDNNSGVNDSNVVKVNSISIFPNPSNNIVNVNCKYGGQISCTIFTMSGNVVMNKQILCNGNIDISNLASGVYSARFTYLDEEQREKSEFSKIVKL